MTRLAAPNFVPGRRWMVWAVAPLAAAAAMGAFWATGGWPLVGPGGTASAVAERGKFHAVAPVDMDIKVVKDGDLQAVDNIDVRCQVEGQNTIVQIVKEGAFVKKGDVLVVLDSSAIRQKIADGTLLRQTAEADLASAREMLQIQESQNEADVEAARIELELAKLGLEQFTDGTYPEQLANAKTAVQMAEITVRNKEEELDQTKALFKKGFVTAADVKADELEVTTAGNDLRKSETALKVLSDYTYQMDLATKRSAVVQGEQGVARARKKAASTLAQVRSDVIAKEQTLAAKVDALKKLEEQLEFCTIKAPADGLVVYASGNRDSQQAIQEGAQVRERQPLLRLPDMSSMKAVLRVNETQVTRLAEGQRATVRIVGVPEPAEARLTKISPVADSGQRWWNPDLKEYPIELELLGTPGNLRPGVSVQAEIFVQRLPGVLAVPLASIYSDRSGGYVFVRDHAGTGAGGTGVTPTKVRIGQTNETHAQITEGLVAGQSVLLLEPGQGRELLERAGIKPGEESRAGTPERSREAPEGRGKDDAGPGPEGSPGPQTRPQGAVPAAPSTAPVGDGAEKEKSSE